MTGLLFPEAWTSADKYVVMMWFMRLLVAIPVFFFAVYLIALKPWEKGGRK